jgi:hypothetical protein
LASVHEQIGELGVGAVRGDEPGDVIAAVPPAPFAGDVGSRMSDKVSEPSRGMDHVLTKSGFFVFGQLRLRPQR